MLRNLAAAAAALTLVSCATPYQRDGLRGGYEEVQLDTNVFRVSFQGNAYTSPRKVTDYILLRSAEITLLKGFRYFQVAGLTDNTVRTAMPLPASATTTVTGNQATTVVTGEGFLGFTFPSATQTIICYKEKPETYAFNAAFVAKSLGSVYGTSVSVPGNQAANGDSVNPVPAVAERDTPSGTSGSAESSSTKKCAVRVISAGGKAIPEDEQCR